MSKHILKDNYERMFGQMKEDWWDDMDSSAQAQYIKAHPASKQAQQADDEEDDYDMGAVPGSRELDDTPEDDSDEKGSSLTSAPGRVPDEEPSDDEPSGEEPSDSPEDRLEKIDSEIADIEKQREVLKQYMTSSGGGGVSRSRRDQLEKEDKELLAKWRELQWTRDDIQDEIDAKGEPSDEEELDPQKIKDDYATAGENLTFSKGELDDAKAMGDEEEISRMQSIVDNDRKEFVASRKTYYTANQEKIEDDYDTAEENMNFSRGELEDAKEMGDEEEISRIQSNVDDDRKEFRKSRRELGRMEKAVGAKSPRTGNELNQETLMIGGKQYRRISEGVEKQPKPKYEFSEFYKRFKK